MVSRISEHATLDEAIDYFHQHGWTDGLPIVPPTEERVKAMLQGTSHSPNEIVSESMWPEGWVATVEHVAINAVMAGAKPGYMPLLLSLAETWGTSRNNATVQSTNSFSYMVLVNGPIRNELDMNSGTYALGPGNQANATVGRALRLFIMNLGGGKPGVNMQGTQGNPSMYSFAFAEDEEASPWESFAVANGFAPEDSVVTIFSGGWSKLGNYLDGNLDNLIRGIRYFEWPSGVVVLMAPQAARMQAAKGLSRREVEQYIWENATLSLGEFKKDTYYDWFVLPSLKGKGIPGTTWPKEFLTLPDTADIQVYPSVENVRIIVVGGEVNPMMQGWKLSGPVSGLVDKWR